MFLTRIGFGSKVVVTGDVTQVDVPNGKSGLAGLEPLLTGIDGLTFVQLGRGRRRAPPDRCRHRRGLRARRRERRGVPPACRERAAESHRRRRRHCRGGGRRRAVRRRRGRRRSVVPSGDRRPHDGGRTAVSSRSRFVDHDEIAALNAEHLGARGGHRRAVVPARRRRTPGVGVPVLLGDVVVLPGGAPPSRRRPTPARSTTNWPCWSSTACCTCSATTTPSRPKRPACGHASWRCSRPTTGTGRCRPASVRSTSTSE